MPTKLVIVGHGENKNGSFDPGATGLIAVGEHRYYENYFIPALKKFLPANSDVVIFSAHNVYDYRDLVTLARKYGNDTIVIEMHYDAGVSAASGGHVIVHSNYAADAIDLKIRDVIKKHIGVRYNHKGQAGISGRNNLYNCNVAMNNGINYRLIELGFGTNAKDVHAMINNVEAIAKDFAIALTGKATSAPVTPTKETVKNPSSTPTLNKTIDALAREVIQGTYGDGEDRKKALGDKFDAVQAKVDQLLRGTPAAPVAPANKTIAQLVEETKRGVHGNGAAREKALGSNFNAVMAVINGKSSAVPAKAASKSIDQLVKEVYAGDHGDGEARKKSLGGNYNAVMAVINGKAAPKPVASKSINQLVKETLAGEHGNGDARKKSLGSNYNAVMAVINGTSVSKPAAGKSIAQLVQEVYAGKHGDGEARKKSLGSNYQAVQNAINKK